MLQDIIFMETTTIGIRKQTMQRYVLEREMKEIDTPYGKVRVKICQNGSETYVYPEYESMKRLAGEKGIPLKELYRFSTALMKSFAAYMTSSRK